MFVLLTGFSKVSAPSFVAKLVHLKFTMNRSGSCGRVHNPCPACSANDFLGNNWDGKVSRGTSRDTLLRATTVHSLTVIEGVRHSLYFSTHPVDDFIPAPRSGLRILQLVGRTRIRCLTIIIMRVRTNEEFGNLLWHFSQKSGSVGILIIFKGFGFLRKYGFIKQ